MYKKVFSLPSSLLSFPKNLNCFAFDLKKTSVLTAKLIKSFGEGVWGNFLSFTKGVHPVSSEAPEMRPRIQGGALARGSGGA